ncbi:hypothetical protein D3C72_1691690 [compost metagenome]
MFSRSVSTAVAFFLFRQLFSRFSFFVCIPVIRKRCQIVPFFLILTFQHFLLVCLTLIGRHSCTSSLWYDLVQPDFFDFLFLGRRFKDQVHTAEEHNTHQTEDERFFKLLGFVLCTVLQYIFGFFRVTFRYPNNRFFILIFFHKSYFLKLLIMCPSRVRDFLSF